MLLQLGHLEPRAIVVPNGPCSFVSAALFVVGYFLCFGLRVTATFPLCLSGNGRQDCSYKKMVVVSVGECHTFAPFHKGL